MSQALINKYLSKRKPISFYTSFLFCIVFILYFVQCTMVPFTDDVIGSFAAAFQAKYYGHFPQNVYDSWTLRGIGYKYLVYFLYRIAYKIVGIDNKQNFEVCVKLIYYFVFLSGSYYFFYLLKNKLLSLEIDFKIAFSVFSIIILTTSHIPQLQSEEVAIFYTLGFLSFLLAKTPLLNYISGLFLVLMFSLKGITILYAFPVFLFLLVYYNFFKQNIKRTIWGLSIIIPITALTYLFLIPNEIHDLKDATLYQSSLSLDESSIIPFVQGLLNSISSLPYIIIGFLAIMFIAIKLLIYKRNRYLLLLIILMIFSSCLPVFVQSKFFPYHYISFLPFTYVLFLLCIIEWQKWSKKIVLLTVSFLVSSWLFYSFSYIHIPTKHNFAILDYYQKSFYNPRKDIAKQINTKFRFESEQDILFLSDGSINYFIDAKSSTRYFYPLPLQRARVNKQLTESSMYKKLLIEILSYKGNYIVLEPDWFQIKLFPQLVDKINNEYENVFEYLDYELYKPCYQIYKRKSHIL